MLGSKLGGKPFLAPFTRVLRRFQKNLGRQEDAHEFFTHCVTELHMELAKLGLTVTAGEEPGAAFPAAEDEWKEVGAKNKKRVVQTPAANADPLTPAQAVFAGRMRLSLVKQASTALDTVSLQSFYSLHLDIGQPGVGSVADALDALMAKNSVEGYRVGKAKRLTAASQETSLDRLPRVLVLHLKRFSFDQDGAVKLPKHVAFDSELTINPRHLFASQLSPPEARTYFLRALVAHHGPKPGDGHYSAFVRLGDPAAEGIAKSKEKWLHCEDEEVRGIEDPAAIYNQQAYLLFYETALTTSSAHCHLPFA
jgi:ubiquitin carboxyl-terminal hydrolase 10